MNTALHAASDAVFPRWQQCHLAAQGTAPPNMPVKAPRLAETCLKHVRLSPGQRQGVPSLPHWIAALRVAKVGCCNGK